MRPAGNVVRNGTAAKKWRTVFDIPIYLRIHRNAYLLNTKFKVQVACAHHPHVLTASLLKPNTACPLFNLATPLQPRSLLSENHLWMDLDSNAYLDEA